MSDGVDNLVFNECDKIRLHVRIREEEEENQSRKLENLISFTVSIAAHSRYSLLGLKLIHKDLKFIFYIYLF